MLHHVAIEVAPELMAAEGEFWLAAGFERVPAPEALGGGFDWYEREGTQIHLMETTDPALPPQRGHIAVATPDIGETIARLEAGGFAVTEGRQLWGERRVKAVTPAGHVVEIMAAPPAPATGGQA
ncbi:MAG: hypothetical protein QG596_934 [Actinomycetota bacterium]|jgi:catechol 2,3-dioxygenase-like lactoylglutathione lyase family enzyme|nr:hypothetical protein [Actinomycetota bacterium]